MKSCYLLLIFIINGQILGSEFTAATNESNIFKTIYSTYALGFGGNVLEVIESNQSDHNWIGFSMRNDFYSSTRSMMINFPIIFVNKMFIKTDLIYSAIYDIPNTEKMMVNALNDEYPDYSRISYFNYKDYGLIIGLSRVQNNILKTELLVKPFMTFAGQYRSHGLMFELNYQRQINQNALA